MKTWHEKLKFFSLAKEYSTWSKDPSTVIGAVAINDERDILSHGWNGFPRKIEDTPERLNDRPTKYKYMVHGEMNCIYNATRMGRSLKESTFFVYGLPVCSECAKGIIQVGVKNVFMCYPEEIDEKWKNSFEETKEFFDEAGIKYESFFI